WKGGTTLIGAFRRPPRRYWAVAVTVGLMAAMVVALLPDAGSAVGKAVSTAATAKRVSATAARPVSTVDLGRLPQVKAGVSTGKPQALRDLSPLGEKALERAQENAAASAPRASAVIREAPAAGTVATPVPARTG